MVLGIHGRMALLPVNYAEIDLADFTAIFVLTKVGRFVGTAEIESTTGTTTAGCSSCSASECNDGNQRCFGEAE